MKTTDLEAQLKKIASLKEAKANAINEREAIFDVFREEFRGLVENVLKKVHQKVRTTLVSSAAHQLKLQEKPKSGDGSLLQEASVEILFTPDTLTSHGIAGKALPRVIFLARPDAKCVEVTTYVPYGKGPGMTGEWLNSTPTRSKQTLDHLTEEVVESILVSMVSSTLGVEERSLQNSGTP